MPDSGIYVGLLREELNRLKKENELLTEENERLRNNIGSLTKENIELIAENKMLRDKIKEGN